VSHDQMSCADAVRRLWDLLEDDLGAADRSAVEAHLAWCRRCCGELAFARELQHLLRARTAEPVPGEVRDRLEQLIDAWGDPAGDGAVP
jgi:anti-sigma factor (TIGR02949 family)